MCDRSSKANAVEISSTVVAPVMISFSMLALLAAAVAHYGIDVGQPKFLSNRRKIDDEQFEYQKARLEQGLVPDPFDIGNYKDELAAYNKKNPAIGGPGR